MIRKLTTQDQETCLSLLKEKAAENLFIIGDIEAFGFDQDFQELWGEFDESNDLKAVLLRYYSNYIAYAPSSFDSQGFAAIINQDQQMEMLSGIKEMTDQIIPFLNRPTTSREMYYAKCTTLNPPLSKQATRAKLATLEDVNRIVKLRSSIPEFKGITAAAERLKLSMEKGISRTYYIEEDREMVSAASTTAENFLSAMVVAVCTLEKSKNRGYASECITKLCQDVLAEGKELCLFYDNPAAGSIYKKIGFVDIGKWVIHQVQK